MRQLRMQHLTSVVFVVFLAMLASFGSFWWSRYAHARHQSLFGWTALAMGTVFLLAAVAIMVMSASRLSLVSWQVQEDQAGIVGSPSVNVDASRPSPFERATGDAKASSRHINRKSRASDLDSQVTDRQQVEPVQRASTARSDGELGISRLAKRRLDMPAFDAADPWAATRCVIPIQRDPAQPTRWTIENDCSFAVGIVIAACSNDECDATQRWNYEAQGVVLPRKLQRSVTAQEQTFYGERVEHLACALATQRAIELIGESNEERATEAWRRQFAEARALDDCLAWVTRLSEQGRRSGVPIHALIGGGRLSHSTN
jgi:hypothetical protein